MKYQCCFCGASIGGDQRPVELNVKLAEADASQVLYCHGACMADALHPSVPLTFRDAGIIFIQLLDEGTDVWRPVEARKVGENRYEILTSVTVPEGEKWMFAPGSTVLCELRRVQDETMALVAVAQA